jgi:hypothetical protein
VVEELTRPQLDRLAVADEPGAALDHQVELLLPLTLGELVVGDDEEPSLVRLERSTG